MRAQIVSIGNELLLGFTVNSNAAYLGRRLAEIGVRVERVVTVGDETEAIVKALQDAFASDVVIATGGIGPTHDDVTVEAVAAFLGADLETRGEVLDRIRKAFEERGTPMPESSRKQARVPRGSILIDNPVGMAPGLHVKREGRHLFVLPGVPDEMRAMMESYVLPTLRPLAKGRCTVARVLRTTGIYESALFDQLGDVGEIERLGVQVAFLPGAEGVDVRLVAEADSQERAEAILDRAEKAVRRRIGRWIYGVAEKGLEEVVAELFFRTGKLVATAESCTGGLLANRLTDVSGSSKYFERGVVAYSNRAKVEILGVSEETLKAYGAVSGQTAVEMAQGVRRISGADLGVSTTGIAGPTGGTPEKPVGLVFVGFSDGERSYALEYRFRRDRLFNKMRATQAALDLLRRELLRVLGEDEGADVGPVTPGEWMVKR